MVGLSIMKIFDYDLKALEEYFISLGEKPYRVKQISKWVFKDRITDFDKMTDISLKLRLKLKEDIKFFTLELLNVYEDLDSKKFLFKTNDNSLIESVLIKEDDHFTLCVSTQIGCAVNCSFCATAKLGLKRNLSYIEIVDQFLYVSSLGYKVRNVVFMGMGEPLANYNELRKASFILVDENYFNLSKRHVTISTSGYLSHIKRLKEDIFLRKLNLAVSINAPNSRLRNYLMPGLNKDSLEELIKELSTFPIEPRRKIMLEYVLIKDVNDSTFHAREFLNLIKPYKEKFKVNLIPYNPHEFSSFERPTEDRIYAFQEVLTKHKIPTLIRFSKGQNIKGACGQLALLS